MSSFLRHVWKIHKFPSSQAPLIYESWTTLLLNPTLLKDESLWSSHWCLIRTTTRKIAGFYGLPSRFFGLESRFFNNFFTKTLALGQF